MPAPKGFFENLSPDQLALLARNGDKESLNDLWEGAYEIAGQIAAKFTKKYTWVDREDLHHNMLMQIPNIVKAFKPDSGTCFEKYLYWRLYNSARDALRREDPLGIKNPQKQHYPSWSHLGQLEDPSRQMDSIVNGCLENMRRNR